MELINSKRATHVAISAAAWSTLSPLAADKLKKAAANIMNKSSQAFSELTEHRVVRINLHSFRHF
jgi:hypothetical protein